MKIEKFKNFLESLKSKNQDPLIESIHQGFQACFENDEAYSLKDEMKNYLRETYQGLMDTDDDEFNFDMESAIYWYATEYHSGQWSPLYSILSTSEYTPGRMHNSVEDDGDTAKMLFDALVDKYKDQNI